MVTNGNGDPPMTIRTLYDLVKRLDEKVDQHQEQLAVLLHELQKPPLPCPRSEDVHEAMRQAKHAETMATDHERRLVVIERVIAAVVALWALVMGALSKLLYDLLSGSAHIMWK